MLKYNKKFCGKVTMKRYRYKFSGKIIAVASVGLIIAAACFIMNIIRLVNLIKAEEAGVYAVISVAVAMIMSVAFTVIIAALFADSRYVFEDKFLIVKFGFIRNTYEYKKIKQIVWFKGVNKLTVFFFDESFSNIVIDDSQYTAFADELKAHNPAIVYYEDINS